MDVIRLRPYQYTHVLDNNTSVSRLLVGPMTYTKADQERVLFDTPQTMVCIPEGSYCVIENPVVRGDDGNVKYSANGQAVVRLADVEIRFAQEPFPLYPFESLKLNVSKMKVLTALQALRIRALRDYVDADGIARRAGDEWQVQGPCTYVPCVEAQPVSDVKAVSIGFSEALQVRAVLPFTDDSGTARIPGEEWLIERRGAFMPPLEVEVVGLVRPAVLTPARAVHVRATTDHTDRKGTERVAGQEWLVTHNDTEAYIPLPCETVIATVPVRSLNSRQYAIVDNYVSRGVQYMGQQELRRGPQSFFLHPGEQLSGDTIHDVVVLAHDESLLLFAERSHSDGLESRQAGTRWMLNGPAEYIPPIEVRIVERRKAIPLDATEGVYIRNLRTGEVRAHVGMTVMLTEDEELWEKPLSPLVEELLQEPRLTRVINDRPTGRGKARIKHKVVTCNVPHSSVCQVYNFRSGIARVVLGPSMVMLMPDEEFTVFSLSGGKPKKAGSIKTLALFLGPDFMTDLITVETSDHARLELHMSYNWEFRLTEATIGKVFAVRDFVGDACKAVASRIRGFIANEPFDAFHRNSSSLIRLAVFGKDKETNTLRGELVFPSSGLVITNIDVHSVDPVDPKTREALTKSVQLAIEITTKSQEASAQHHALSLEQEAKGRLARQTIEDRAVTEAQRKSLLEIDAHNAAVESSGASKAHAKAMAEAKLLEGQSEVDLAQKRSAAASVMAECEMEVEAQKQECELAYLEAVADLELAKTRALSDIEAEKFEKVIAAVGKDTIRAIARSGPEMQVRLLKALGLQGYLVTDGSNPINLFNTAKGMAQSASAAAVGTP